MFLLKCIPLVIIFFVVPFFLGNLLIYKKNPYMECLSCEKYILGHFAALALFWVLCVPMAFLRTSFTFLAIVYSICLIFLCCISFAICHKERPLSKMVSKVKRLQFTRFEKIYLLLFLLLLGIQLYFAMFYESTVWSYDDYDYVVRSLDTITSDHMSTINVISGEEISFSFKRVLNSWDIYISYLSKLSGFHVTTVAHTIIPTCFLLIGYLVYTYIAKQLFDQRENRLIFLCILSVAFIFGLYSPYSLTFRLLVTLWQGKAVLSSIVIPFLIFFLPDVYNQDWNSRTAFDLLIISMAACSLTMMGSGMSIIIYTVMLFVISLYRRNLIGLRYYICGCVIPALQMLLYLIMR